MKPGECAGNQPNAVPSPLAMVADWWRIQRRARSYLEAELEAELVAKNAARATLRFLRY